MPIRFTVLLQRGHMDRKHVLVYIFTKKRSAKNIPREVQFWQTQHLEYKPKWVNLASVDDRTALWKRWDVWCIWSMCGIGPSEPCVQTSSGSHRHGEDCWWGSGLNGLFTDNLAKREASESVLEIHENALWRLSGKEPMYAVWFGHLDVYIISECVHFVDP